MEEKLISVLMGAYNCGPFLGTAVESILEQTYRNWELIVCDDGSSDDTLTKLREWEQKDTRIRVLSNEKNFGLAYSLNRCFSVARGTYIARMDADDVSYPDRFQKQISFLEDHREIAFVSGVVDLFDGEKIVDRRDLLPFPQKKDLIFNTAFVHPATVFRREALESVDGYRVSKETKRGQDYDLFMRMYGKGWKGANLQQAVYRYTEDGNALKRRSFQARAGEMKIRYKGYKAMGVLPWAFPFVFKPFVAFFVQEIRQVKRKFHHESL